MQYRTTEAYISGGICGAIWWPADQVCGIPVHLALRPAFDRFAEPASLADVLDHLLMEQGGDFQNARFTADTRVVVVRKAFDGAGKYRVHVRERELGAIAAASDYVNAEHFTGDFME